MTRPVTPIQLYGFPLSGHAHRARLMLTLLGLSFEETTVDLAGGEQKRPPFLERNVFGKVPVIVDGEQTIADSNAILVYLAARYDTSRKWLPQEPAAQAAVQRWLSIAAGPLAYGPAAARLSEVFGAPRDASHPEIANDLFRTMERHLERREWLARAGTHDRGSRDVHLLRPRAGRADFARTLPTFASLALAGRSAPRFRSNAARCVR